MFTKTIEWTPGIHRPAGIQISDNFENLFSGTHTKKRKKNSYGRRRDSNPGHLLPRQSLIPLDYHGDCQYLITKTSVRCISQTSALYVMKRFGNIFWWIGLEAAVLSHGQL